MSYMIDHCASISCFIRLYCKVRTLTTRPFWFAASRTRSTTSSRYRRIPLSPFLTSVFDRR